MEDMYCSHTVTTKSDGHRSKSKKQSLTNSKKNNLLSEMKSESQKSEDLPDRGAKRPKRRKTSDSFKKLRKEDLSDAKSNNTRRHSSATPDSEPRQEQSESPITDDVFEGSNSSQESIEMLSMSSLLKSVLDRKKKVGFCNLELILIFLT